MERTDHWSLKHGFARTQRSAEYTAYQNAKARCRNPKAPNYAYYGGRGIEFRFTSFEEFISEIGCRPSLDHSVDRIDNNGHYEPGNIRWATRVEQQHNVRAKNHITANGLTLTVAQWAEVLGGHKARTFFRQRQGWCDNCIINLPSLPVVMQTCQCLKISMDKG
jgi:hypothetical protein